MGKFFKIGGVGWDIHGYSVDPETFTAKSKALGEKYETDSADWLAKKQKVIGKLPKKQTKGKEPGKLRKFFGAKTPMVDNPNYAAQHKTWSGKSDIYNKKNPAPRSSSEYRSSARIKTKFDKKTNYKLNMHIDYNTRPDGTLEKYTTDTVYGNKKVIRNLSKQDLQKVLVNYKTKARAYKKLEPKDPWIDPGVRAFVGKAESLLKNPKTKFIRLEYE